MKVALACSLVALIQPARAVETSVSVSLPANRVWFDRALDLDLGTDGAPDAVKAFEAMRRAATDGDPQAAFNVAVMYDSGRGAVRDHAKAAEWYARAAARGVQRGAFNLAMLYETGDGVPANVDLARAWYKDAGLPAARKRASKLKSNSERPKRLGPPKLVFPTQADTPVRDDRQVDLVWTSRLQPKPIRFFVELRGLDEKVATEIWSGFVDVSSVRLPLTPRFSIYAWRVSAVAKVSADYAVSDWSVFSLPGAAMSSSTTMPTSSSAHGEASNQLPNGVNGNAGSVKNVSRQPTPESTAEPESANTAAAKKVSREIDQSKNKSGLAAATTTDSSHLNPSDALGEKSDQSPKSAGLEATSTEVGERTESDDKRPVQPTNSDRPGTAPSPQVADTIGVEKDVHDTGGSRDQANASAAKVKAAPEATRASVSAAKQVLIILAQPNVAVLADLNGKSVVIAGLSSISKAAIDDALNAGGAHAVRLTSGTKQDVDKLVEGDVSAAIVACVAPAKAQTFPEIPGFNLLRVTVNAASRTDPAP